MKFETMQDPDVRSERRDIFRRAQEYRAQLEKQGQREGTLDALSFLCCTLLESFGRAMLDLDDGLLRAIELLDLAGALRKEDIRSMLLNKFTVLASSDAEEDQLTLVKALERFESAERCPRS